MAALNYIGSFSVGLCVPGASAALASAYADLQARIAALASFNPQPVSFTAQLALLATMTTGIEAMIALGIPAPSISLQIALVLAQLATLEAELSVILGIQNAFGAAGVFAYAYDGPTVSLGPATTDTLALGFPGGTPNDHCNALILATTIPATWAAMGIVFKTS